MSILDQNGNALGNSNLGSIHYEFDNFSSSNVLVYFGDILIDEAMNIRFDVQQTRTPVYGYASQYYTFVADGHVLVSGSLTINFKEAGYLFWPIQSVINQQQTGRVSTPKRFEGSKFQSPGKVETFAESIRKEQNSKAMKYNVEQAIAQSDRYEKDGTYRKRLNQFHRQLSTLDDDTFEQWAEEFEDAIWFSSDPANAGTRSQLFSKNLRPRTGETIEKEDVWNHRRADQYPEIDIAITYGDYSSDQFNHTVKKILGVSFIGQSQIIESSGQPILEEYTFIARNVV